MRKVILERFLSKAKFFLGEYRQWRRPEHFENQLFFNINSPYWNEKDIGNNVKHLF